MIARPNKMTATNPTMMNKTPKGPIALSMYKMSFIILQIY